MGNSNQSIPSESIAPQDRYHQAPSNSENDTKVAQIFKDLIQMGFSEQLSLEVAKMFPHNLNDAMDYIVSKDAIDNALKNNENDTNDIETQSDHKMQTNNNQHNRSIHPSHNNSHRQSPQSVDVNHAIPNPHRQSPTGIKRSRDDITKALQTANIIIRGEYNPDITSHSTQIISDLINTALSDDTSLDSVPQSFTVWTNGVHHVKLNGFYYEEICSHFLAKHRRIKNLYAFDKITALFKNVRTIEAYHTGWVSLYYFEALLDVLGAIRSLEYSKLEKICLFDINNMGSIPDKDFKEYQMSFRQKHWDIRKGVSDFIISRYY